MRDPPRSPSRLRLLRVHQGFSEEPRYGAALYSFAHLPKRPGAREGHGNDEEEEPPQENFGPGLPPLIKILSW